jgi:hypothetical protein
MRVMGGGDRRRWVYAATAVSVGACLLSSQGLAADPAPSPDPAPATPVKPTPKPTGSTTSGGSNASGRAGGVTTAPPAAPPPPAPVQRSFGPSAAELRAQAEARARLRAEERRLAHKRAKARAARRAAALKREQERAERRALRTFLGGDTVLVAHTPAVSEPTAQDAPGGAGSLISAPLLALVGLAGLLLGLALVPRRALRLAMSPGRVVDRRRRYLVVGASQLIVMASLLLVFTGSGS